MTSIPEWKATQDMVKRPLHYQGKRYELWDIILDFGLGYFEANIVKYVVRWKKKNGLEDLYKARQYLDKLIAEQESKTIITEPYEELPENLDG